MDNRPIDPPIPERTPDEARRAFHNSIARGRAVAEARRQGVEMVDAERLADMFTDLALEGFVDNFDDPLRVAQRGIEILRG